MEKTKIHNQGDATQETTLGIIDGADQVISLLNTVRLDIIARLRKPGSASSIARETKIARQKVNYHLRELEKNGFVKLVEERRRGNCIERIVKATADSYVISPAILGALSIDTADIKDRFSASYQIAVAAKTIKELASLQRKADKTKKKLATFALSTEISIKSPAILNEFSRELSALVTKLVRKYHDESEGSRKFNVNIGFYPSVKEK